MNNFSFVFDIACLLYEQFFVLNISHCYMDYFIIDFNITCILQDFVVLCDNF